MGITGPKLLYADETLQSGGLVFSEHSDIPYAIYKGWPSEHPAVDRKRFFQAVTGACLAVRAEDWIALEGFDAAFFNGCEDVDLCLRLSEATGRKVLFVPECTIYHLEGGSPGRNRKIGENRARFSKRWKTRIEADDLAHYRRDGFEPVAYEKVGTEPDGPTALYRPVLAESGAPGRDEGPSAPRSRLPKRRCNIGVCSIWYVRGISIVARQITWALEGEQFRTHVLARWETDRFENRPPVFHPRVHNAGDDPTPQEMVDWATANQLDLVIFMEVHPNDWPRVRALKRAGFRVMAYESLDILHKDRLANYAESIDYLLFAGFHAERTFRSLLPGTPGLLVPWGCPRHDVLSSEGGDRVRMVHVAGWGGLEGRKNTAEVLRAFDRANPARAELRLFSQAPLATYGSDCVDICEANDRIVVHEGTARDVYDAYREADLLVWPSKREGLGLPIVEALACGIPVLVSDGFMMKEWPVLGEHGIAIPGEVVEGIHMLPKIEVEPDRLASTLAELADRPERLEEWRSNVLRDRSAWLWSWQAALLRRQIGRIVADPDYVPADDLSYLPAAALRFEDRRRAARERAAGLEADGELIPR